ncbi:MAG: dienelactone hydrolase family protein [Candidatus Binataceae bacterium]
MKSMQRIWLVSVASALLVCAGPRQAAAWTMSQFVSNGEPVEQYACAPDSKQPSPAVILLHGAEVHGASYHNLERICTDLAAQGYYAEMIEYYSQGEEVVPGEFGQIRKSFRRWVWKIHDGLDALGKNPAVDPKRIGVMGYSLGGLMALAIGARHSDQIAAVVDYYGGLPPSVKEQAATMPPTLIIHGGKDRIVLAQLSRELDKILTDAGRPHQLKLYPDADHAFNFDDSKTYDTSDTQAAWTATLDFLAQYLKGNPPASQ